LDAVLFRNNRQQEIDVHYKNNKPENKYK